MSELETNVKAAYDTASDLAADLAKLGTAWVRYGLSVGESSLQTSAHTLEGAAQALRKMADRIRNR